MYLGSRNNDDLLRFEVVCQKPTQHTHLNKISAHDDAISMANANVLWLLVTLLLLVRIHVLNRELEQNFEKQETNRYQKFTQNTEIKHTEINNEKIKNEEIKNDENAETPTTNSTVEKKEIGSNLQKNPPSNCNFKNSDIRNMMYHHPDFPLVRGRPFSGLETHAHIMKSYLDSKTITLDPNHRITPQPITGVSANHFLEHQVNAARFFDKFRGKKILFMDLGLTPIQVNKIKADRRYIYKKFDFRKYPAKTEWLTNMAFKVFSIMECLMKYQACMWWDASIRFTKNSDDLLDKYVYGQNSSFVYYIKPAGHSVSWATHPMMFSYSEFKNKKK